MREKGLSLAGGLLQLILYQIPEDSEPEQAEVGFPLTSEDAARPHLKREWYEHMLEMASGIGFNEERERSIHFLQSRSVVRLINEMVVPAFHPLALLLVWILNILHRDRANEGSQDVRFIKLELEHRIATQNGSNTL